jgi:regulator of protease activity HflC (stomatin/prohibitin superfamily)
MWRSGVTSDDRGGTTVAGLALLLTGVVLQLGGIGGILGMIVLVLAIVAVSRSIEIVEAYEKRALTVFGEFRGVLGPGINFIPPFVSETHVFDMRTQMIDVPHQEAITRDNSPVVANAVVYIRVMNAEKSFLEVENYKRATANLAQTTLRAVLGDMELDETLSKRREINEWIRQELAEPTDEWGVRVESVEVQEITPSDDVKSAMEQQTAAERRRRAMILEAQGERRSAIESAQGEKQSNIIRAQGEKQAQILESQGDAISTVLRARSADAMGERAVIDKGLETLGSIGADESTTYVLPQELTSMVGRYGKHLTGSDVSVEGQTLDGQEFDDEEREMLGLDDIEEILGEIEAVQMDADAADAPARAEEAVGTAASGDRWDESDDVVGGGTASEVADRSDESDVADRSDESKVTDRSDESEVTDRSDESDVTDRSDESDVAGTSDVAGDASGTVPDADSVTSTVEEATKSVRSLVEDAAPDVENPTDPASEGVSEADGVPDPDRVPDADVPEPDVPDADVDVPETDVPDSDVDVSGADESDDFEWETPDTARTADTIEDAEDAEDAKDEATDTDKSN